MLIRDSGVFPLLAKAVLGYRLVRLFKLDAGNAVIRCNFQ